MRLWGGRFNGDTDSRTADFTRSIEIDNALATDDIAGSVAHVRGLGRAGLLEPAEVDALIAGLEGLRAEVDAGTLAWDPALEDVHMNLEAALVARIGAVAGKLHTGRSRNDQVATDLRLWTRRTIDALDAGMLALERSLVGLAERDGDAILPGTTHIQPAQPVLFAHHLLAYVEMLERDRGRLADCRRRSNVSPLGSGALAGAGYPLDREATARELGFDGVTANSLDAVSDRDFVAELLFDCALAMVHLSRLAEEITWWSNPRFGFVRASDAFSTGSSMMPNKKNPDPAELVRGRAARIVGSLAGFLALLKGLPLAYQRDLQEDKPPLFEACATLEASLDVMAGMVGTLSVDAVAMRRAAAEGLTTATAVADALVRRGLPFRAAHHVVGRLVAEAERASVDLAELTDTVIAAAIASAVAPAGELPGAVAWAAEAPGSVAEAPGAVAWAAEAPGSAGEPPGSVAEAPGAIAWAAEAPGSAGSAEPPRSAAEAPGEAPVSAAEAPGSVAEAPGAVAWAAEAPGSVAEAPGAVAWAAEAPGSAGSAEPPRSAAEAPGSVAARLAADPTLPGDLRAAATLEAAMASCDVIGGTAPTRVAAALAAARARLDREG